MARGRATTETNGIIMECTTTIQNENEVEEPEPIEQVMEVSQSLLQKRRRRPTLGRAARHRRRKLKELAAAAAAQAVVSSSSQDLDGGIGRLGPDESNQVWLPMNGPQEENKNSTITTPTLTHAMERIVPSDRQHVWPAIETMRALPPTDQQELIYQLGYLPGNALEIAARGNVLLRGLAPPLSTAWKSTTATTMATARMPLSPTAPVVLKLYPLVLREETNESATKGRNKSRTRRRQQQLPKSEETLQGDDNPPTEDDNKNVQDGQDPEAATKRVASDNHPEPPSVPTTTSTSTSTSPNLVEPFPTIYWVTHPHIKALISKLELEGWGLELERRLALDEIALESMVRAHASYGLERRALVTKDDWTMIESCHWEEAFFTTRGVAGIRTTAHRRKLKQKPQTSDNNNNHQFPPPPPPPTVAGKIKCLHAHAAHYWSGCHDNRVGQWVAERVTELLVMQQQPLREKALL
jgi:hypothetical protein